MNYLLELRGINSAKEYDIELKRVLSEKEISSVHYDEHIE
jgi:hypothetical protein